MCVCVYVHVRGGAIGSVNCIVRVDFIEHDT